MQSKKLASIPKGISMSEILNSLHRVYSRMRMREHEMRSVLMLKLGLQKQVWSHGLFDELQYWERVLSPEALKANTDGYLERLDPQQKLEERFTELINVPTGAPVSILDVGAGPITSMGKVWDGHSVTVVPIDPLAERYRELLDKMHLTPPVYTVNVEGEKIGEHYPANSFELAHSRNALDHCYDPMVVIQQMVDSVKPACFVYLWHVKNVADMEQHKGLHQWNFDHVNGKFMVSSEQKSYCVNDELAGKATVKCHDDFSSPGFPAVVAVIQKSSGPANA